LFASNVFDGGGFYKAKEKLLVDKQLSKQYIRTKYFPNKNFCCVLVRCGVE
jgi:hypothetical protein